MATNSTKEASDLSQHHDLESGGGAAHQVAVQLTPEQFERLYLQPSSSARVGDATRRFGNPTPLGLCAFLLCLTSFAVDAMGLRGGDLTSGLTILGAYYSLGGFILFTCAILEWVLGNTFPFVVFGVFSGFWISFAMLLQPSLGIQAAFGGNGTVPRDYYSGVAIYLVMWGILCTILLVASLRTNLVFASVFLWVTLAFYTLGGGYYSLGQGQTAIAARLFKTGGASAFLCSLSGWYMFIVTILLAVDFPYIPPVGDLSTRILQRKVRTE